MILFFNLFLTVRKRCFLRRKKWISRITQKGNVDNTDKLPSNWDQILARDQMLNRPITGSWRQLASPNINSALYMIHYLQSASDSPPNRGLLLYLGSFGVT